MTQRESRFAPKDSPRPETSLDLCFAVSMGLERRDFLTVIDPPTEYDKTCRILTLTKRTPICRFQRRTRKLVEEATVWIGAMTPEGEKRKGQGSLLCHPPMPRVLDLYPATPLAHRLYVSSRQTALACQP